MSSDERSAFRVFVPWTQHASTIPAMVSEGASVQDVVDIASKSASALKDNEAVIYKCGDLETSPNGGELMWHALRWIRAQDTSSRLDPKKPLKVYFPNGATPRRKGGKAVIDIIIFTESMLKADYILYSLPDFWESVMIKRSILRASRVRELQVLAESRNENTKECLGHNDLHMHRPALNYGPHTSLFSHAFARLRHRLDHLDDSSVWTHELEPDADLLETCHLLVMLACDITLDEFERELKMPSLMSSFIGKSGSTLTPLEERGSLILGVVWGEPIRVICEDNSGYGLYLDQTVYGAIQYGKLVSQQSYKKYIARSNCPVILISIVGTRIEISTAIFVGGIYIDKLISQELYLDAFRSKTVLRLGRIGMALRRCYDELSEHYDSIDTDAMPTVAHLYPNPLPVDKNEKVPELKYAAKLAQGIAGIHLLLKDESESQELENLERPHALYLAKMEGSAHEFVVVKFTAQYNVDAHRLLAAHGLAPEVYYFARLVSGHYMIVMDHIPGPPLSNAPTLENSHQIYEDVEKAVRLLHEEDLVFGDVRPQNIVLTPEKRAMLVDFDITGKHGVDRYPATWNDDHDIFPEGVRRWGLIEKEHDIHMLEKLKVFLEEHDSL